MHRFNKNKTIEAVKKFREKDDKLITYEELSKFELNKIEQIRPNKPGAIECIRISTDDPNTLMFTISMQKGEVWEQHHHDCCETCIIFKGELKDELTGYKAGPAQELNFKIGDPHRVIALAYSIFYVQFKKPE